VVCRVRAAEPLEIVVLRSSGTQLSVSWTAPPGPVAKYGVFYCNAEASAISRCCLIIDPTETTVDIGGLDPHADYMIQVVAEAADARLPGYASDVVICNKMTRSGNPLLRSNHK